MFETLTTYLNKIASLNDTTAWFQVIDREAQFEIIRLNTIDQLFDEGERSDGTFLPNYSRRSVEEFGKPEGHIKLKDTGRFYQSFRVKADKFGFFIAADDESVYDEPLTEVYGENILGLTDENMRVLINLLKRKYFEYINERLSY
jgi:hypothetical protein